MPDTEDRRATQEEPVALGHRPNGRRQLALDLKPRTDGFALVKKGFAHGLLINAPAPDALRFMPALNVSDSEITQMLERLDQLLESE